MRIQTSGVVFFCALVTDSVGIEMVNPYRPLLIRLFRAYRFAACLFLGVYLAVSISPAFVDFWVGRLSETGWTESDGDILIALTADVQPDGLLGFTSYWRAVYTVRAWRSGHFKKIVVSGGYMGTNVSLASAFAEYLIRSGIPAENIVLEERSTSTHENAIFTAELLKDVPGKKVLLTSDIHVLRAAKAFQHEGLDVTPRTFPDVSKSANSPLSRFNLTIALAVETLKIGYYYLHGWL
jgi:uncharacterized SAM-binding protein YcdF (DUF218 family)